jgi:uncharacterized protein YhaN
LRIDIRAIHIAGFGKWRDRRFELEQPAVLLFGGNEAGKSTLLAFIRFMLFGSPPRKGSPDLIEPWSGTEAGGWLELADGEGRKYRLERFARVQPGKRSAAERSRIVLPDGSHGPDSLPAKLLGGLTAELYRNLFAFSLRELQELSSLQSDEIGSYLFSSGLGIAPAAIRSAEKELEAEMDELFRPRGQNRQLNIAWRQLEQAERELSAAKEQLSAYNRLKISLAGCEERIAMEEEGLRQLEQRERWLRRCLDALPHWLERLHVRRALQEGAGLAPEDEAAANEAAAASALLSGADEEKIRLLADGLPKYEADERDLAVCLSELDHARTELRRIVRQIDPGWTIAMLRQFPATVAAREQVQRMRERLLAAETAWQECRRDLEALLEERRRMDVRPPVVANAQPLRAGTEPDGPSGPEHVRPDVPRERIARQMRAVRRLIDLLREFRDVLREKEQAEQIGEALDQPARRSKDPAGGIRSGRLPRALLFALLFVLWIGGTAAFWQLDEPVGAGAVFALLGGILLYASFRPKGGAQNGRGAAEEPIVSARQRLLRQLEALDAKENEFRSHFLDLVATDAGLPRPLAEELRKAASVRGKRPDAVDELRRLAEEWLERLTRDEEELRWRERERSERRKRAEELEERIAGLERRLAASRQRLEEARRTWEEWKRAHHLPEDVSPDSAPHLFTLAEHGLGLLAQMEKLEKRAAHAEQSVRIWREAAALALGLKPGEDAALALKRAAQELEARKARREARQALENRLKELDLLLHHLAGEEGMELLEASLKGKSVQMLEEDIRAAAEEKARLEASIRGLREEKGAILNELKRLASDEEHSRLLLLRQERAAAAEQLAERWVRTAFALELLRWSRRQAEDARQPRVMKRASAYFSELTGGRYERVIANFHDRIVEAVRPGGERMMPHQLSRGTAEQLYLAIRFALAREHARHAAVPLILDDIFVNFDAERLEHSVRLLAELSRDHQIVMFTCHPHIRSAAERGIPGLQIVELA